MATATQPTADTLDAILSAPIPAERGRIRHASQAVQSGEVRKLFRSLGIKGCGVTTPKHARSRGITVIVPQGGHDCSWNTTGEHGACEACDKRGRAVAHLRAIILGAFPDMDDRSDAQVDYFNDPIRIK